MPTAFAALAACRAGRRHVELVGGDAKKQKKRLALRYPTAPPVQASPDTALPAELVPGKGGQEPRESCQSLRGLRGGGPAHTKWLEPE